MLMVVTPLLKTERMILRPFQRIDAPFLFLWCSSKEVTKYLFYLPHKTGADSLRLLESWTKKRKHLSWAMEYQNEVIGEIEIIKNLPEHGFMLGYTLREDKWHQGLMSEGLKKVFEYMKEEGYLYALAETDERNVNSINLLKHNGFFFVSKEEGRYIAKKAETVDVVKYKKDLTTINQAEM